MWWLKQQKSVNSYRLQRWPGWSPRAYRVQIYKGDPRSRIPPLVMALSAMGLKLVVFGFLPTTHAKTEAKQMCSLNLCAPCSVLCMLNYLHAQTVVDVGDIYNRGTTVILITGKIRRLPIWVPCRDKNGAGCGISLVYLWYRDGLSNNSLTGQQM